MVINTKVPKIALRKINFLFPDGNTDSEFDLKAETGVEMSTMIQNLTVTIRKESTWLKCFTKTLVRQPKKPVMAQIPIPMKGVKHEDPAIFHFYSADLISAFFCFLATKIYFQSLLI